MSSVPKFAGLKGQNLVYAITACSGLGFLLFGYDLAFMGGLVTSKDFLKQFGNPKGAWLGFMISSYEVGALLGCLYIFLFGDKYGRKTNTLIGAAIICVGATLQAAAYGVGQFLTGRVVAGMGLGMMTTVIPVWLTECAQPKSRGRMVGMQLSNLVLGLIIANWLDYGMLPYKSSFGWRFPCAFQMAFCLIIGCIMPFLPESPRYLAREKRYLEAEKSLSALRNSLDVAEELDQIKYAIEIESEQVGWSEIFKCGDGSKAKTRVAIAFWANAFQQLTGSNVISSFGPYVFQKSLGMSRHDAIMVSGFNQVWFFLSSLIAWWAVDRFGRRKLFFFGSIGMTLCMLLAGIFIHVGEKHLQYGTVVVLYIFYTFFTVGWQANMWVYPSEILPLKLRVRGNGIAVIGHWFITFLVVEITPTLITNIGWASFLLFAVFNLAAIPAVYFFFPETNQLPLEAVDLLFTERKNESIFSIVKASADKNVRDLLSKNLHETAEIAAQAETKAGVIHREVVVKEDA